jgi:hypothetical protein
VAAIFVRGYVETFVDGEVTLRGCQDGGVFLVKEYGGDISIPYVSKMSRLLDDAEVVRRTKKGRSYVVGRSDFTDDFIEYLTAHPEFGSRIKGTQEQEDLRIQVIEHLELHGSVRSTEEHRIPGPAYKYLAQQVREGQLDVIFVQAGLKAGVKYNGRTIECPTFEAE